MSAVLRVGNIVQGPYFFILMPSAGFRKLKHTSLGAVEEDGFCKGAQQPPSFPYHNHDVSRYTTEDIASIRVSLRLLCLYSCSSANYWL